MKARTLSEIVNEIRLDWKTNPKVTPKKVAYCLPHLVAMGSLNSINENYICESGREIVARFLCNATQWQGETARRIKKELNAMLK